MDDSEPTLPPAPDSNPSSSSSSSSTTTTTRTSRPSRPSRPSLLTRKRTHDETLYDSSEPLTTTTSSDPALFSDDEHDSAGAENYASKRKKKIMYTGSWWSHRLKAGKGDRRKEFKRNYDSGIFMGSDSEPLSSDSITSLEEELMRDQAQAEGSRLRPSRGKMSALGLGREGGGEEEEEQEEEEMPTPTAATQSRRAVAEDQDATPRKRVLVRRNEDLDAMSEAFSFESSQRQSVVQIIRQCLEDCQETVDLSGQSLSELPVEVGELAYMTKQTNLVSGMLERGTSLEAQVRLFLGNNFLRRLNRQLFELSNLRELSLRRNKLAALPAAFRHLVNLEKLNVSGNKLTQLPFEIVELAANHRLHEITTEPNLWQAMDRDGLPPMQYKGYRPRRKAISGRINMPDLARAAPLAIWNAQAMASGAPSLLESVLRQIQKLKPVEDLKQYMPPDTSWRVLDALTQLENSLDQGGLRCNSCQRSIVYAGQQWTELWRFHDVYVPVLRLRCSESCDGQAAEWCETRKGVIAGGPRPHPSVS